jgi:hypothetical protein
MVSFCLSDFLIRIFVKSDIQYLICGSVGSDNSNRRGKVVDVMLVKMSVEIRISYVETYR